MATYTSFGGTDITAVFNNQVFGELQMVSYRINREKAPVYTMGSVDPRSIARGKRMVSGVCVFIIFDKDSTETAVESVETLVEETEEEVVGTTEETTTQDTEVKATKRGTRKTTTTK